MENLPSIFSKRIMVMGCGNILFGDDGFGPAVAEYMLKNMDIPDDVYVDDVGTAAAKLLFTLVHSEAVPERIIIVDAVDLRRKKPGEIFWIDLNDLPEGKAGAYSIHEFPDTNLLKELRDGRGVEIQILACQVERIPKEVAMGLSASVKKAVPKAAKMVIKKIKGGGGLPSSSSESLRCSPRGPPPRSLQAFYR